MSAAGTPILSPQKTLPLELWERPIVSDSKSCLLSISGNPDDHKTLNRIVDHKVWQVVTARTCRSGIRRLEKGVDVIFSECSLADGTWKDIMNRVAVIAASPPLIVTSRLADAYLWSEVLNLGGFDVLAKPLNENEVRQVLAAVTRFRLSGGRRVRTAGVI